MESQSDSTQTVSSLKLLMLKTGDYDLWSMRMEQYLTHTDYALWEVIVNGDAPAVASASTEGPIPPKTAEQKIARKNELKAKSTLLLAIPDEHLLKFHGIKDAKSLWEAIKTRFGGNKESKKMQKTILKQQYENFTASRSEGLDKIYDRFQKLISQLEIQGEVISQEDANLKLLRSLPSAWNNIALIMRNKPDLDELSMDDLYNNLKVYEAEIKSQSSSNSNSQNVAFVSSENTSSTNEAVNTALDVSTASTQGQASSSTYADDVMFSFFVNQSKSPLLDNEDMEQIDSDDLEEMDLKWQVAMLTMRIKRFIKKTRRNLNLNGKEAVGLDMTKFHPSSSRSDSEALESLEARIVIHEKNKASYEESIAFLKYDVQVKDISIKNLKNQLEEALKKKDDLKLKLENFKESSKNLTKLINSQISVKDKTGTGFNIMFKKSEGYHAVLPPFTRNFKLARADLSFVGLDDSVYKSKVIETITSVPNVETTITKTSKDSLEKPKTVRFSAPIIEDWESDSEDENVFEPKEVKQIVKSSFKKIEFVNAGNSTVEKPEFQSHAPKPFVNVARPRPNAFHKSHSPSRTPFNQKTSLKNRNLNVKVNTAKENSVNKLQRRQSDKCLLEEQGDNLGSYMPKRFDYVDPQGKLKHMTGNKFHLSNYQDIDGGFVAFGGSSKGCKITGKGDLTCLFTKVIIDESNLWHRRLGHINFKTMNKLVRGNLVRGLPSKLFENDHTCVACQMGKQHKASCKTKTVSSICKPLQLLHMDLFRPVSVISINRKSYCLVVTDDFSRFSWVFFLATKDETPEILKNFITGIENQSDHKVKTIKSDNGTEFKNRIMNEFFDMKGIRREFSVARTPQQNGVVKRKNRTIIEAARTMLADSKLLTTF
ncbi:putative ribonuclease H-like domain-containing protein [Tanacetum coccineum]